MSILIGLDGWVLGVEPRSKVSMMIMGPPQHGHGSTDVGGSSAGASASPGSVLRCRNTEQFGWGMMGRDWLCPCSDERRMGAI